MYKTYKRIMETEALREAIRYFGVIFIFVYSLFLN